MISSSITGVLSRASIASRIVTSAATSSPASSAAAYVRQNSPTFVSRESGESFSGRWPISSSPPDHTPAHAGRRRGDPPRRPAAALRTAATPIPGRAAAECWFPPDGRQPRSAQVAAPSDSRPFAGIRTVRSWTFVHRAQSSRTTGRSPGRDDRPAHPRIPAGVRARTATRARAGAARRARLGTAATRSSGGRRRPARRRDPGGDLRATGAPTPGAAVHGAGPRRLQAARAARRRRLARQRPRRAGAPLRAALHERSAPARGARAPRRAVPHLARAAGARGATTCSACSRGSPISACSCASSSSTARRAARTPARWAGYTASSRRRPRRGSSSPRRSVPAHPRLWIGAAAAGTRAHAEE